MHSGVKIVQRLSRGCGNRKTHGLYLVGSGIARGCDRLPIVIEPCPCCGGRPRFSRGIQKIDFVQLYGAHKNGILECDCPPTCPACWPSDEWGSWLMWVGKDYTMESFVDEAMQMGVSKRIANIPTEFVVGKDWVFLAKKNAGDEETSVIIPGHKTQKQDLIFYAFRPRNIEYIITEAEAENEEFINDLLERGITPVLEVDNKDVIVDPFMGTGS